MDKRKKIEELQEQIAKDGNYIQRLDKEKEQTAANINARIGQIELLKELLAEEDSIGHREAGDKANADGGAPGKDKGGAPKS